MEQGCFCTAGFSRDYATQLIFGTGTQLIVEPKFQNPSTPSVFVMKNGTNVACLVKDFYPKSVDIHLSPEGKAIEGVVTTANGKFSAVKLSQYEQDLEQVKCTVKHNNHTMEASYKMGQKMSHENSTEKSSVSVPHPIHQAVTDGGTGTHHMEVIIKAMGMEEIPKTEDRALPDLEASIDQQSSSQKCHKSTVQIEKVNLLSITLLGLRVLLAKSIAVNFFLTIKCFLL